ncbi:MAG: ATP cone domain-containing protein, partial [Bacteroidales bacterium]
MEIIKRNGTKELYDRQKIATALQKSFLSTDTPYTDDAISSLIDEVELFVNQDIKNRSVEKIQDEVERVLMENGYYSIAKSYILYRWQRTERRRSVEKIINCLSDSNIGALLKEIQIDYPQEDYDLNRLAEKFHSFCKAEMKAEDKLSALIKAAVELTSQDAPDWEFIAARLQSFQLNNQLHKDQQALGFSSFYDKLRYLVDEGLYGSYILNHYSFS